MRRNLHPRSARWAAAIVSAVTVAWLLSTSQPGTAAETHVPGGLAAAVHAAAGSPTAPLDTGASDMSNLGSNGWAVQSSAVATQSGAQISTPGFNTSTWLPVTNDDAGAP